MICFPNAKINLGLNIVSKRADGYHNLETIFYPIKIEDALEIVIPKDATEDNFFLEGLSVDGDPSNNLVWKALQLMRKYYSFPFIEVHLLKAIPMGAGIGGGSSDAAFMLKLLNTTFEWNLSKQELVSYAVQLGADCPFYIYNQAMYAEGIGEVLSSVDLNLDNYIITLVKPNIFVSTKEAFSKIVPKQPKVNLKDIVKLPIEEWKDNMINDFEDGVFHNHPELKNIKNKLYEMGAIYASMSGSGSSIYALSKSPIDLSSPIFESCYTWTSSEK